MKISKDPFNLVISGVGGQGNIVMSRMISGALLKKGYFVTIVEDIGPSQRAGAVNSNIRISSKRSYGPMIPKGHADFILSLEPLEMIRILSKYGNPEVLTLTNFTPVFPVTVICGQNEYPDNNELREAIRDLSKKAWFVDATQIATNLGATIVANIIMTGALISTKQLPLTRQDIENEIRDIFPLQRVNLNLKALEEGLKAIVN